MITIKNDDDIGINPIADMLGIPAESGTYALTNTAGKILAVIQYLAAHHDLPHICETAYDAAGGHGVSNAAFGVAPWSTSSRDANKAKFAARFLIDNPDGVKTAERAAKFSEIEQAHRLAGRYFMPACIEQGALRDGAWRLVRRRS